MFGMGFQEMVMILVVALIVIGPKRLPELARTLGKGLAEFRRATDDFRRSVADDETVQTIRKTQDEIRRTTADLKRKALAVPVPKDLVPELVDKKRPEAAPAPAAPKAPAVTAAAEEAEGGSAEGDAAEEPLTVSRSGPAGSAG